LWLIKVWFSASTFVVKIATFAKPENVIGDAHLTFPWDVRDVFVGLICVFFVLGLTVIRLIA
jgi:hypothetical protein